MVKKDVRAQKHSSKKRFTNIFRISENPTFIKGSRLSGSVLIEARIELFIYRGLFLAYYFTTTIFFISV